MAPATGNDRRGFGSMDDEKKRRIASEGGKASAQANTSNRGFASMDKDKQRKISSQGGRASKSGSKGSMVKKQPNSSAPSSTDEDMKKISRQADASEKDINALEEEELEGVSERGDQSAAYSDTDEDENEGLGDGNLGRSTRRGLDS